MMKKRGIKLDINFDLVKQKKEEPVDEQLKVIEKVKEQIPDFDPDAKDLTNKYKIIKPLGGGAFKTAHLAHLAGNVNKLFVLFEFKNEILSVENQKEIAIFKKLLKNIKKCYKHVICPIDYGYITETKGEGENKIIKKNYVLVSNFIKGDDLSKFLLKLQNKKDKITLNDKIDIMLGLIKGLNFLHNKLGFVHFDLKPENIQIQKRKDDFDVAIIDLGVGCFNKEKDCKFQGSPFYGSPEVLELDLYSAYDPVKKKEIKGFDFKKTLIIDWQKTDIYAMGLIFMEILNEDEDTPIEILKTKYEINCKTNKSSTDKETRLKNLICKMTQYNFYKRPGAYKVLEYLTSIKNQKSYVKRLSLRRNSINSINSSKNSKNSSQRKSNMKRSLSLKKLGQK
jgi:serine/threonine protein kinase